MLQVPGAAWVLSTEVLVITNWSEVCSIQGRLRKKGGIGPNGTASAADCSTFTTPAALVTAGDCTSQDKIFSGL